MSAALVTGITGQDGTYLAEILHELGYQVIGTTQTSKCTHLPAALAKQIDVVELDLTDTPSISELLYSYKIEQIYNFAAYSSGEGMFEHPIEMAEINGLAVSRILESIRSVNPLTRLCQASSSEMFGYSSTSPQNENTPFHPRTPYGAAKLYAHTMVDIYRRHYGIFACSAILYNHESPRRGINFVSRKIAKRVVEIKFGLSNELCLGTLDARRDWGFAKDYVNAMRLMLIQDSPDDYIIATGKTHSVRELCECAFSYLDLDYRDYVKIKSSGSRAFESKQLVGDASKARSTLGWEPTVDFTQLIHFMVDHEIELLSNTTHPL